MTVVTIQAQLLGFVYAFEHLRTELCISELHRTTLYY